MSEENLTPIQSSTNPTSPNTDNGWKIRCLCSFCKQTTNNGTVEINFFEQSILFMCSKCRKMNKIVMRNIATALPKTRIAR